MIQIKCFPRFDGPQSQILISGEEEDYALAAKYLSSRREMYLNDPKFGIYHYGELLSQERLYLNKKECLELKKIFLRCKRPGSYHYYFDTQALKNIMDIKISIGEYPDKIFNR